MVSIYQTIMYNFIFIIFDNLGLFFIVTFAGLVLGFFYALFIKSISKNGTEKII